MITFTHVDCFVSSCDSQRLHTISRAEMAAGAILGVLARLLLEMQLSRVLPLFFHSLVVVSPSVMRYT